MIKSFSLLLSLPPIGDIMKKSLYDSLRDSLNSILRSLGFKRKKSIIPRTVRSQYLKRVLGKKMHPEEEILEFYEPYIDETPVMKIDIDDLISKGDFGVLDDYSKSFSYWVTHTSFLPSKRDFQYAGIADERAYFLKLILGSIATIVLFAIYGVITGNPILSIFNGLIVAVLILLGGTLYPKIRLTLFRGEIKIQILISILHIISLLNSGASIQEALKNIATNPEYGITYFEFRNILYDINRGGYNFIEAIERAKRRTKIGLMKKLYDQLIIAANKGGTQLLLENLYNEIVRESLSKIDSSKFQISNLGNLVFGVGMILPFAGMMQSALGGQQGFDGIINTIDLVLTKIGPISTLVFAIFIKMKIE